jgi:hypothetical protein
VRSSELERRHQVRRRAQHVGGAAVAQPVEVREHLAWRTSEPGVERRIGHPCYLENCSHISQHTLLADEKSPGHEGCQGLALRVFAAP